ncbi:MAG: hypothetical protein QNJ16_07430 [Rhodobacter sp.]|nr:hypothetical protein [Rhodobacter sp.]
MRLLLALAFSALPSVVSAGVVFQVESTYHSGSPGTQSMEFSVEKPNLKMEIRSSDGKPNKDVVLILRDDGSTDVILVDHLGRTYGVGTMPPSGPMYDLRPTGRMEMGAGGVSLHIGGGPGETWLQMTRTNEVGAMLPLFERLHRASVALGDEAPEPLSDEFWEAERRYQERSRRALDPSFFEPPADYRRREMLLTGPASSKGTGSPGSSNDRTNTGGGSAVMSETTGLGASKQ